MSQITEDMLKAWHDAYEQDEQAHVLNGAEAGTELKDLAYVPMNAAKLNGDFEVEVKTRGITAQQKSGRCWLFAALNILREKVAVKLNVKEFELSQNYLSFYDKLEKANNFLEMVIQNADHPSGDQLMQYILRGIDDGGYWGMAVDLIAKYGVVPKSCNPESYQSDHTDSFMTQINHLLRKDAMELRDLVKDGRDPSARKKEMLAEVYRAECIAFGEPVRVFDYEYRDNDGNYHCLRNMTPQKFCEEYVGIALQDYVPVVNEPYEERPMHTPLTFHSIGNMADRDLKALNLTMEEVEDLCVKQLRSGEPVWFACDAGAYGDRKKGVWDPASVNYEGLLGGVDFTMPKGERLRYKDSAATHAMLLTGVSFDENGKPSRWKIENSWGKDVGKDGYFVCSEAYFENFVYEAVIDEEHLSEEQKKMLEKEPVSIPAWEEE